MNNKNLTLTEEERIRYIEAVEHLKFYLSYTAEESKDPFFDKYYYDSQNILSKTFELLQESV